MVGYLGELETQVIGIFAANLFMTGGCENNHSQRSEIMESNSRRRGFLRRLTAWVSRGFKKHTRVNVHPQTGASSNVQHESKRKI